MSVQFYLKKNLSRGYLSTALGTTDTIMTANASPNSLPTGDTTTYFFALIWNYLAYPDPADDPGAEVVIGVWVSGTTYTILRGQDDTVVSTHVLGSKISLNYTAGLSTNDISLLGSKVFSDNGVPNPGYFVWFNGNTNQYELHAGSSGSSTLPFGTITNRPISPNIGDWYLAIDTQTLYTCYTTGTWTVFGNVISGSLFTNLEDIPPDAGVIPRVNLTTPFFVPNNIQTFNTGGTYTWVNPGEVTQVYVKVVGAGGEQGINEAGSNGGGGGGGGGYAEGVIAVSGNATVNIGSTNSFEGDATISATSGSDGGTGSAHALGAGGSGGTGSGGTINLTGATGQSGIPGSGPASNGVSGVSAMGNIGSNGDPGIVIVYC